MGREDPIRWEEESLSWEVAELDSPGLPDGLQFRRRTRDRNVVAGSAGAAGYGAGILRECHDEFALTTERQTI